MLCKWTNFKKKQKKECAVYQILGLPTVDRVHQRIGWVLTFDPQTSAYRAYLILYQDIDWSIVLALVLHCLWIFSTRTPDT